MAPVFRVAADIRDVSLDAFVAVFHRASGITHLLSEPAPQILAALTATRKDGHKDGVKDGLTRDALAARLAADYDLDDAATLGERLDELVASGLVASGLPASGFPVAT